MTTRTQTPALESPLEWLFWGAYTALLPSELDGLTGQYRLDSYRLDFCLPEHRVAIELDGRAYHTSPDRFTEDRRRQRDLESRGWRFIRFSGAEVMADAASCVRQAAEQVGRISAAVPKVPVAEPEPESGAVEEVVFLYSYRPSSLGAGDRINNHHGPQVNGCECYRATITVQYTKLSVDVIDVRDCGHQICMLREQLAVVAPYTERWPHRSDGESQYATVQEAHATHDRRLEWSRDMRREYERLRMLGGEQSDALLAVGVTEESVRKRIAELKSEPY